MKGNLNNAISLVPYWEKKSTETFLAAFLEKIRFQACGARGGGLGGGWGCSPAADSRVTARGGCKRGDSPSCRCFGVGSGGNERDHKRHEHCHGVISTAGSPQSSPQDTGQPQGWLWLNPNKLPHYLLPHLKPRCI